VGINDYLTDGYLFGSGTYTGGWTTITTNDTATASAITIWPGMGVVADDEPDEPAPSTPIAWLDERIAHVTKKGREALAA
jgi:hypothetical protein